MKKIIALSFLGLTLGITSCVTSTPQSGTTTTPNARTMSIEAEARQKTSRMDALLKLSADQKDDVMVTNTVYLKVLKNLRENNDTSKMDSAKDSYMSKLKSILTTDQYSKFVTEMGG